MSLGEATRQVGLIAKKDLQETFRSKAGLAAVILAPLLMMALLGYVFPSVGALRDVPFAVVNADEQADEAGSPSSQFLARFAAANDERGTFVLQRYASEEDARDALRQRDVRGVLIIPERFSEDAASGIRVASVQVLYDQSDPNMGRLVAGEASRIVGELGAQDAIANVQDNTRYRTDTSAEAFIQPYRAEVSGATAVSPSYFQFLAPGLMTLGAVGAVMSGLPASFNGERTKGTLDTLLVAPISRWTLIMGKVAAQFARGLFQALMLFLFASLVFGVTLGGSALLALFLLVLTISAFVGIGVFLVALAANEEGAGIGMLFYLPALLLSGVVFPVEQLPTFLQWVSKAIPLTYAVTAMRKVMILGAGIDDILPEVLILLAFGVVTIAFAGRAFHRALTR